MSVNIRDIQHFMYCPRRFALLSINRDWAENVFVVKADIMHENVHSGRHEVKNSKRIELSSVTVYNDELDIFGVTDCIEFVKNDNGVYIEYLNGKYDIKIIEYKPTSPKNGEIRETDAIQVFAQKLCVDWMWGCESEGYIYYSDTRKRVKLPFDIEYGDYLAKTKAQSKTRGNVLLRKAQFERLSGDNTLLIQNTIAAKLANTKSVVKRTLRDYPYTDDDGDLSKCLEQLDKRIGEVYDETDPDTLRGIEGLGAKAYFDVFDRLILQQKDDFHFSMRTKRPPLDRVNADDFEAEVGGAVYLNKEGKRKVLTKWQERKRSEIVHPYLGEKIMIGLIPYVQSMLLAKYIRGEIEEYPNYIVKG